VQDFVKIQWVSSCTKCAEYKTNSTWELISNNDMGAHTAVAASRGKIGTTFLCGVIFSSTAKKNI